jgi:hypothetical protein
MRHIWILTILVFYLSCEKNHVDYSVQFNPGSFSEVLVAAQTDAKKVLVDFWADG